MNEVDFLKLLNKLLTAAYDEFEATLDVEPSVEIAERIAWMRKVEFAKGRWTAFREVHETLIAQWTSEQREQNTVGVADDPQRY